MPSKPSYKNRWARPTGEIARKEFDPLRRELRSPRTQARRLEIETRLDEIASNGTPVEIKVSKPTREDLDALCERAEAARENGTPLSSSPEKGSILSEGSPVSSQGKAAGDEKGLVPGTYEHDAAIAWRSIPATPEVREAAVERYWIERRKREDARLLADPVRRRLNAALYVAESTDNPLRTHARKFADSLTYDLNNMGSWEGIAERRENAFINLLWEVLRWDRPFPHPTTDPKWAADIFAEVDRRDLHNPLWFARVLETPKPPAPPAVKSTEPAAKPKPANPEPPAPSSTSPIKEEEAQPSPIVQAGLDLAQRVNLIFQTDSFLRGLSAVNFELNEKIRSALTTELLRAGHIQGTFAATLYNSLRREYKLWSLPERRF